MGVNVQAFPYIPGDVATIESQIQRLAGSSLRVVVVIALGYTEVADIVDAALAEGTTLGPGVPSWWFFNDFGGGFASLPKSMIASLHGAVQIKPTGALASNPRWAAFASQGWPSLSASVFNRLLPEPFHMNQSVFAPGASDSVYVRDIATYKYDAVAALGLLACQVAPTGSPPADFGTQLWKAATSADFEFEGLSGVVRFDERGDRDQLTANIQLYNVLQAADGANGANGTHVEALVASYQGTREVPWLWQGGSMSASGVVFNGGADTPPKDMAPASSSTSPFPFLIGFGCLFGVLFVLVGVYLLAKYKKGKIAEAKRRKTEEDLAKARADAHRERNLMAIIFHELRNPLNGVVAHLRLGSQAPAESAERLQSALVCTEHALSFLNGLSQIEKLEASAATALRLESCSLYEVVQSVVTIVSPQLKPGVKMLTTLPPPTLRVQLDRTVLAQVLINLLQNAAANTSSGFVEFECSASANSASDAFVEVALVVRDTGQGMSDEVQAKIFDRYQSVGGIGLGMYLTKLQIQQMGSSISVQSPWTGPNGEQSGAKFSFKLHLEVASLPSPKVASQAARAFPVVEVDLLPEPQLPRQLRVRSTTSPRSPSRRNSNPSPAAAPLKCGRC
jgi:signal transduction histidine kinase